MSNSQDGNTSGSVTSDQAAAAQELADQGLEDSPMYRQLGEEGDPFSQGEPAFTAPDDAGFGGAGADAARPEGNPTALVEGNIVADERDLDPEDDR